MSNILYYIKWRGDLTIDKSPMNELDYIILARFSYLPFKLINFRGEKTIQFIKDEMQNLKKEDFLWPDDKEFISLLGDSIRFKSLIVSDYVEVLDEAAEKQFSAVSIELPNNVLYISFRGTDSSLVGWKEDLNMGFLRNVPSQIEAVKYLNKIATKNNYKLVIGGHSKGGNLAVYSAIFCDDSIKERIEKIINADGPGMDKSVIQTDNYKKVLNKIETYIPQSSIVGRLLEHEEEYQVVKSVQKGVMQHDIYSWQVEPIKLVRIPNLTNSSEIFNGIVRDWLMHTTPGQRKNFINVLYEIVSSTDAKRTKDFSTNTIKKIKMILNGYKNIDEESKRQIDKMIKLLLESTIKVLKENVIAEQGDK